MHKLIEALNAANEVSALSEDRGMASVEIRYHPYKATWEAMCSWSDQSTMISSSEDPVVAMSLLTNKIVDWAHRIRSESNGRDLQAGE